MAWLRMDAHAQWEIQEFAKAMYGLVKPLYPSICEAYEDYKLYAVRLSRMEVGLTKAIVGIFFDEWNEYITDWFDQKDNSPECIKEAEKLLCKKFGLTKRELTEFKEKWS
jgi:thymidylate synthase ThyX